jgi:predicted enzyme related to lactoylglutathione lyase
MEEKLKKQGAISWSELLTSDVPGAKKFYSELFGWTFEDMPMEKMTYSIVKANDNEMGGIMPIPPDAPPMPPAWGLYITVNDVDAVAEQATGMGAKVAMVPQDIPGVGRFCVLQDPQGAYISIISYSN